MPNAAEWNGAPMAVPQAALRRLRHARWVVIGSFAIFALLIPVFGLTQVANAVKSGGVSLPGAVVGTLLSLPLAGIVMWMMLVRMRRRTDPQNVAYWTSLALLAAVFGAIGVYYSSLLIASVWWATVMMVRPRRRTVVVTVALIVGPWVRVLALPEPDVALMAFVWGVPAVWAVVMLVTNYGVLWLWEVANEATAAREAQARLAVTEERLRFSRDMHDLLGHSLSALSVKSELAARLAERAPEQAAREMLEVQRLAREALREVRTAVSGYREVDLDAEIASVRSVLGAAGVDCTVTGDDIDAPAGLRALTAWLVREAGTNVLRHSTASRCDITLRRDERALVVEVYNNGARAAHDGEVRFGNGLTGLSERAAAVRGEVSASLSGKDGFLLRAVLPLLSRDVGRRPDPAPLGDREGATG
ncbi:sensor histidine kinase [Nocardiopsis rhodophaea]|uniref:sensor histidine kinase n=1 Tax=Nocardiopsis rhodophaea TaxID=280238 RepID=UPI0031D31AEF